MPEEIKEIKTIKITEKGQICIPTEARRLRGFQEGSKISILVYKDRIELRPMKKVGEKLSTALASEKVLAKDWASKEDNTAWKDL